MTNSVTHWHIAGLGAIGSLCNATALNNHTSVSPIVRKNSQTYCTEFIDLAGSTVPLTQPVAIGDVTKIQNLVVPLKSYDVIPFLTQITSQLADNAQVVLCHNGMGTIKPALDLLPKSTNLYFCTSSHGVFKQGRQAHYAGNGESQWQLIRAGNDSKLTNADIETILPNATQSRDLNVLLWQKLIINCAINPVTAIFDVNNGELADAKFQPLVTEIVEEAVAVAQANQIDIEFTSMLARVNQVIELTGANSSSMRQDVQHKRQTEIDFINGYLLGQANTCNIAAPRNTEMVNRIQSLNLVKA